MSDLDNIFRKRLQPNRVWDWGSMMVGEVRQFKEDSDPDGYVRAQQACHTYANDNYKPGAERIRFTTKRLGGVLYVKRIS